MNINPTWTDERIEQLTALWRDGKSAGQIAKTLGGVSRNAVIGKVHRLGLQLEGGHDAVAKAQKARADRVRREKRAQVDRDRAIRCERRADDARKKAEKIAKIAAAKPARPEPVFTDVFRLAPLELSLLDLRENDCRFPVSGEKADTLFCGHNVEAGGTYCTYHARVAYIPREVRLSKQRAA